MRIILIIPDVHLKLYFPIHKEAIDCQNKLLQAMSCNSYCFAVKIYHGQHSSKLL